MNTDKTIKRKYSLSDYDPNWVNQFWSIKLFLEKIFGDKALQIEHIGSTSIPGMKAKPVIDALVIVETMEEFSSEKEAMVNVDYEWRENYIAPNTLVFYNLDTDGEKLTNIHVCEKDSPKTKQFLVIRDFFRAFPEKAKEYADLKIHNAQKYPDDYPVYRAEKAPFLAQMEQEAYAWKESSKTPNYKEFSDPRLVALYDTLNPLGVDSEFFCQKVEELWVKNIIDLGCGTGLLTCELAQRGYHMIGIEPSENMLSATREKPHAEKVIWLQGSYEQMKNLRADLVIMTSHVAQFFLLDTEWRAMLSACHEGLNPGGYLVFDIRRLSAWMFANWPTENNHRKLKSTNWESVEWWFTLLAQADKYLRYELHYFFQESGEEVVSINELAFRSQEEITRDLIATGFTIETIYGDWDGNLATPTSPEMIFIARA